MPGEGSSLRIVRTEETGEEGYDLWVPTAGLAALWDRLRDAGAQPVGRDAWDVLRVEAGVVRYGIDVDASGNVVEVQRPRQFLVVEPEGQGRAVEVLGDLDRSAALWHAATLLREHRGDGSQRSQRGGHEYPCLVELERPALLILCRELRRDS